MEDDVWFNMGTVIGITIILVPMLAVGAWKRHGRMPLGTYTKRVVGLWLAFLIAVFGIMISQSQIAHTCSFERSDENELQLCNGDVGGSTSPFVVQH